MNRLVDRRLSGKNRSAVNRQRFLRRFKAQIRKAASEVVSGRKVTDMERGEKISIPSKDLSEPIFHHGPGGRRNIVLPGNRDFVTGDRVDRPEGGGEPAAAEARPTRAWTTSCSSCPRKSSWITSSRIWRCRTW